MSSDPAGAPPSTSPSPSSSSLSSAAAAAAAAQPAPAPSADPASPRTPGAAHGVQPLPGADRIRALTDPAAIYGAFDGYPWRKDANFMAGLLAMLGDTSDFDLAASAAINDMATHARIFYYAQRVGVAIDFAQYRAWLDLHPEHKRPMFLPGSETSPRSPRSAVSSPKSSSSLGTSKSKGKGKERADPILGEAYPSSSPSKRNSSSSQSREPQTSSVSALAGQLEGLTTNASPRSPDKGKQRDAVDAPPPNAPKPPPPTTAPPSFSWQAAAPRTQLYIKRDNESPPDPTPPQGAPGGAADPASDEPNYPLRFAEMIRMLQDGVDIPGIRQIPDTVVRDPSSKPFGARVAPRKPWEKDTSPTDDGDTTTPLDMASLEFPPVDGAST